MYPGVSLTNKIPSAVGGRILRILLVVCFSSISFAICPAFASPVSTVERMPSRALWSISSRALGYPEREKSQEIVRSNGSLPRSPLGGIMLDLQLSGLDTPWWRWVGFAVICLLEAALIVGLVVERFWRRGAQRKVQEQLRFREFISHISTELQECSSDDVGRKIDQALNLILEFYGRDRCKFVNVDDGAEAMVLHACYSTGTKTVTRETNPARLFPWSFDKIIKQKKLICFRSLEELPPEAEQDKHAWIADGVKSSLNIPISIMEQVRYVFVIESAREECRWPEEIIRQLRRIGEVFAGAVERRSADHALRESESRFRKLADSAPVLIWCSGPDKQCFYFNEPWLKFVGRSIEQELGNGWTENIHPDHRQKCLADYSVAFDARREFSLEYQLRRFDGVYRLVCDRGIPRFDSDGQFLGYVGSCIDITDLKVAERTLRDMGGRLLKAQEEERRRIARELHDDISQRMALLLIDLDKMRYRLPAGTGHSLQLLQGIIDAANGISSDIHDISRQLHPSKLEFLGLVAAVKGYCRELSAQQDLQIKFTHGEDPSNLSKDIMLCLYRIIQEALHNVVKHSGVRQATVELKFYPDEIYLCVSDLGQGFDVELSRRNQGLGLVSMRERLALVHGKLFVQSVPSIGTRIEVRIPAAGRADRPGLDLTIVGSEAYIHGEGMREMGDL
jgi:PAS domain S-box-containing protein